MMSRSDVLRFGPQQEFHIQGHDYSPVLRPVSLYNLTQLSLGQPSLYVDRCMNNYCIVPSHIPQMMSHPDISECLKMEDVWISQCLLASISLQSLK